MLAGWSFRAKLVGAIFIVQAATLAVLAWNNAELIDRFLVEQLKLQAQQGRPLLNAALSAPIAQRDYATLQDILREARKANGMMYLAVIDGAGRTIAAEGWDVRNPLPVPNTGVRVRGPDGRECFDFGQPIEVHGQRLGELHYCVSAALLDTARNQLVGSALGIALLGLIASAAVLSVVALLLTRPLTRLSEASRRMRRGDYAVRVEVGSHDEIGELARSFNRMVEEISKRVGVLTENEALQRRYLTESRERAEQLARAKEQAESASIAKSRFMGKMSHELRTPLTGVLGTLDLLSDSRLDASQREYVRMARDSGHSLLEMINDVLDFSRLSVGKPELESTPFDVHPLIREAVRDFARRAGARGLDLACDIDASVPASLVGDAQRLRQIIGYLVGNAVKFTERGAVLVQARATPAADGATIRLALAVQDTGIGVEAPLQERVFDPFTQGDDTQTRKYGGAGLGLALAKSLVEAMGGTIGVHSQPGSGSTFYFEVPMARVSKDA